MKLKSIVALVLLAGMGGAYGAAGIFGSYINITSSNHGGTAIWYDAEVPGGGRASDPADFNGFGFGSYNPGAGATLNLTGAEVLTFKNGGSDVWGGTVSYRIYPAGSPSGSFSNIGISHTANATFADASGTSFSGLDDQKWANGVGTTNLLTGLSNGDYVLEAFLSAYDGGGIIDYSNNGGGNYKATFSVVPEPSCAALALLGGLAFLRRRRAQAHW